MLMDRRRPPTHHPNAWRNKHVLSLCWKAMWEGIVLNSPEREFPNCGAPLEKGLPSCHHCPNLGQRQHLQARPLRWPKRAGLTGWRRRSLTVRWFLHLRSIRVIVELLNHIHSLFRIHRAIHCCVFHTKPLKVHCDNLQHAGPLRHDDTRKQGQKTMAPVPGQSHFSYKLPRWDLSYAKLLFYHWATAPNKK